MNTISARRRLIAVLVLPFVLLLAGCGRLHADFEIQDVDTLSLTIDMGIDPTYLEGVYDSAEELCDAMVSEDPTVFGDVVPEPYEEDNLWGCRGEGYIERADFGSDFELTEENGEYHFVMGDGSSPVTAEDLENSGVNPAEFDFQMTFTFPGDIIQSQGGTVEGRTVTYTDMTEFGNGVDITAKSNGFPWLVVVIIVLVLGFFLLLILAVAAFFLIRSRRNKGGGSGGTNAPAAFGGAAGSSAPFMTSGNGPPAAPQGPQWGQTPPPPAPPQGGQQWGQASPPPPAAPQGDQGQQWGQASPPPPAAPQGDQGQQWGPPNQNPQGDGQQNPQNPQNPQGWNQPPQNPGW